MKRLIATLCFVAGASYGSDVVLGRVDALTWTGSGTAFYSSFAGAAQPGGYLPVDILVDFESGTIGDLISTQILDACTYSPRPLGYWVVRYGHETNAPDIPQFPSNLTIGASDAGYLVPVSVATELYSTAGTRGHRAQMSNAYHNSRFVFGGAGYSNLSIGLWFTAPDTGQSEVKDLLVIKKGNGYAVINSSNTPTHAYVNIHTGAGKSPGIQLTAGARYWATIQCLMSNNAIIEVYDTAGALVDTNYLAQPDTTSSYNEFWVGRADNTGDKSNSFVTVDNCMLDLTDATFPLGVSTSCAAHATTYVDGMLMAENFEINTRPLGFNSAGSGITWSSNVVGMEALSALKITNSTGDVWYDLCANYSNVCTYSMVQHDAVANYRYITKFSSPAGTYADIMGVLFNFATKPLLYGVTGGSTTSPTTQSNNIVYHVWTEFVNGVSGRCYVATSPTKPATPTMQGPLGGAAYTNTTVRYIHLNDAGKSYHDKWRISTNAIGSNPL